MAPWFAGTGRLDWRIASGGAAVLAAGLSLYKTWRDAPYGQIDWDGAIWRWQSAKDGTVSIEQSLSVVADFQKRLVLVIESGSGVRLWFCAERMAFPERWMDFRRAVYSPRRTSAIPPGSELSSERVAAVAVSSHAQAQHSIRIESEH